MMYVSLFYELMDKEVIEADHEGYFVLGNREFSNIEVVSVHDTEWSSNSGSHGLETDLCDDLVEPGYSNFIVRPVAYICIAWGVFRVRKLPNWRLLPQWLQQFLGRLDNFQAEHADYDLSFLLPAIERAGLNAFAWWYDGAEKVRAILIVAAPRTEREAAEWFAEWYEKNLPRYLAEKLAE